MDLSRSKIRQILQRELKKYINTKKGDTDLWAAFKGDKIKLSCDLHGSQYGQLRGLFNCLVTIPEVEKHIEPYVDKNDFEGRLSTVSLNYRYYWQFASNPNKDDLYHLYDFERNEESVMKYFNEFRQIAEDHILPEAMQLLEISNLEKFFRKITDGYHSLRYDHLYNRTPVSSIIFEVLLKHRLLVTAFLANVPDINEIYLRLKESAEISKATGYERYQKLPDQIEELYHHLKSNANAMVRDSTNH